MQVRIEDVSPVEKKLYVEVPWATVEGRLAVAYRELSKQVQLKGYRKGKVPTGVLEQMFGRRVRAEVAGQIVQETFLDAAQKHKLEVVSTPLVQNAPEIVKGKPFSFEAIVEVKGTIDVENYRLMPLKKRRVEISDNDVEQALKEVQREQTELMAIEGRETLAESDFAAISFKGTIGETPVEHPQLMVDLGDSAREPIPGIAAALKGAPIKAQNHDLNFEVPADAARTEWAGKPARLTITVMDARRKDVPDIDDDLAKDTGEAETLDELKGVLKKKLEERAAEQVRSELREAALAELVKRNQIPIAKSLIKRAAEYKEERFRTMLGLAKDDQALTADLREKIQEGADDEVRGQLLVDALASKESMTISDNEIDERLKRMAQGQGAQLGRLKAEMTRDGRLENLRYQMLSDKVLDYLIDRAEVTEVDPEQLADKKDSAEPDSEGSGESSESAQQGKPRGTKGAKAAKETGKSKVERK